MKKIVALVLSLVMALSLATVAFAVPLWVNAGEPVTLDKYHTKYNTKMEPVEGVTFEYHAAVAPDYDKETVGNIAYWTDPNEVKYVLVEKYTKDAAFAVKAHDASIPVGGTKDEAAEGSAEPLYFMVEVTNVEYIYEAKTFTAWGKLCEQYAKPVDADKVDYVEYTAVLEDDLYVIDAIHDADVEADGMNCVLVDGVVYAVKDTRQTAIQHKWLATAWDKRGAATKYTCQTCKTVADVIESMYVADKTKSHVQLANGDLLEFSYTVGTPASDKGGVESAKTFDAGVAMYVGMSLLSVAGGAVVIGKKKEF